jgi:hypothetical protein
MKHVAIEKWTDLEMILWSELSQPQKDKYHVFSHKWYIKKQTTKKESYKGEERLRE